MEETNIELKKSNWEKNRLKIRQDISILGNKCAVLAHQEIKYIT